MQPGILLDRDGVINANRVDHVKSWAEFRFLPGALASLQALAALDVPIAVITNQSAIGRGLVSQAVIEEINARMVAQVRKAGGRIDGVWYCPHAPEAGCSCRKPQPGLLLEAARVLGLDLSRSCLIGDAMSDVQAAQAVGCPAALVITGRGTAQLTVMQAAGLTGFHIAQDLRDAVKWVYGMLCVEGKIGEGTS